MKILDIFDEKMMRLEWETAIDGLTYSLNKLGAEHEVKLVCQYLPNESAGTIKKGNITIQFVADPTECFTVINEFKPDRILMNATCHNFNLYLAQSTKYKKYWKALMFHGGPLIDSTLVNVNKVILQTPVQKEIYLNAGYGFISPDTIDIIPFGSDPTYFNPSKVEKKYLLTYQGTFSSVKRNDLAAKCMSEVNGKLLLFGKPYDVKMIEKCKVLQQEMPDKIVIEAERFPNTEVANKIKTGSIGVFPGVEGGTRGLSEYLMCGIPVITFNDSDSIVEVVSSSACGMVCGHDAVEFNRCVETIMANYTMFQDNALKYAQRELTAELMYIRLRNSLELGDK